MRYQVSTSLSHDEVLEQAVAFFGPKGVGLTMTSQTRYGAILQGGGGHVSIAIQPGEPTTIELETRQWDYPVQQFMHRVSRRQHWWQGFLKRKKRPTTQPQDPFHILENGPK